MIPWVATIPKMNAENYLNQQIVFQIREEVEILTIRMT